MTIRFFGLIFIVFIGSRAIAQTEISGVINSYTAITEFGPCGNDITVDNTEGFEVGQAVLVFQAQGATINTSNSSSFGNIQAMNGAGFLERARISSITGNMIFFQSTLLNAYDVEGNAQLITIPTYDNAIVVGDVIPQPWDGSTGGVIAFDVANTLTLNADIIASETGFRGGVSDIQEDNECGAFTNANDYGVGLDNWQGARKGEGIANFVFGQTAGRGAQANGGGGGNDHNSGGGGGANIFLRGGNGGQNREPSFFGCDGNNPGIGGKVIDLTFEDRFFFGGGGGAGHENNDVGTNGGNGGGIIIINAGSIIGNNNSIESNGGTPPLTSGDGAGGGGAGGTIFLNTPIIEELTVNVNGGDGGSVDNNGADRCHGPGGGGSGGRIINMIGVVITGGDLLGGSAGQTFNSGDGDCSDGTNGAQDGEDGLRQVGFENNIPENTDAIPDLEITEQPLDQELCPNEFALFLVEAMGDSLSYQWQASINGGPYSNLVENADFSGTQTNSLLVNGTLANPENISLQVIVQNTCGQETISNEVQIIPVELPTASIAFNILDGGVVQFTGITSNATSIQWNFGDGNSSNEANPSHTYAMSGTYTVSLQVASACGEITVTETIEIEFGISANFFANPEMGCAPLQIGFANQSTGPFTESTWFFQGGNPTTSSSENPVVIYTTPGSFDVTLIISDGINSDTITRENAIQVQGIPAPAFTASVDGNVVTFSNQSINANTFSWDFGDGNSSTEETPIHTYVVDGTYTVTLTATNECGTFSISQTLTIGTPSQAAFSSTNSGGCAPFIVQFFDESLGTVNGLMWEFPGGTPPTSSETNPVVTYPVPGNFDVSLTIDGLSGENNLTLPEYVEILHFPSSDFDFEVDGSTVMFANNSENASSYIWDFGDGNTSTEENPTYTFSESGLYTVTLNAKNPFCGSAVSQNINIIISNTFTLADESFQVFPNPVQDQLFIKPTTVSSMSFDIELRTIQGQLLTQVSFSGEADISLANFPSGSYLLKVKTEEGMAIFPIQKVSP